METGAASGERRETFFSPLASRLSLLASRLSYLAAETQVNEFVFGRQLTEASAAATEREQKDDNHAGRELHLMRLVMLGCLWPLSGFAQSPFALNRVSMMIPERKALNSVSIMN